MTTAQIAIVLGTLLFNWPSWRGPNATGVSSTAKPPVEWSETKNVRWKVEIPGRGSSTPIVWRDRVYVLTAAPTGVEIAASHDSRSTARGKHRMMVLALDRKTGKTIWEQTAREEEPHEGYHQQFGTWASSSAVVTAKCSSRPSNPVAFTRTT